MQMTIRNPQFLNLRSCALLLILTFSTAVQAQYFIKNPSYDKRENNNIDIEAIRFFADSLVIDFSYYGNPNVDNPGYRINYMTELALRNQKGFETYLIADKVNVKYDDYTYVKKKKTENFSLAFGFSVYELLMEAELSDKLFDVFSTDAPFNFNFIECSTNYRTAQQIAYGNCFNFSNIKTNMPPENWSVLFCSGYLNAQLVKGEFETTAQFKSRTAPDSINYALKTQIDYLYDLFSRNYRSSMNRIKKTLTYNADREEFTIEYAGAEKAVVHMPLAKARDFKANVENDKISLYSVSLERLPNGKHHIVKLGYQDSKTKERFELENKIKLKTNPRKEFLDRVMSDLKKYYTAYKGW